MHQDCCLREPAAAAARRRSRPRFCGAAASRRKTQRVQVRSGLHRPDVPHGGFGRSEPQFRPVFEDEAGIRSQLARHIQPDGLGVIEGVMGFYDGVSGTTDTASAAHLARATGTPAVLIVRPKGQSLSLAAQIHGFRTFAENTLAGVILNGVSAGMYSFYKQIAEKAGLPVLGFLPPVPEAEIPDRHLGLVTADELSDLREKIDRARGCGRGRH